MEGHPHFFVCVAGKGVVDGDFVCVAAKGVSEGAWWAGSGEKGRRVSPPPAFCKKSLEAVENKRSEREKEVKERKRAGNSLRMQRLLEGHEQNWEGRDSSGAKNERGRKLVESVGERIVVGLVRRSGGILSRLADLYVALGRFEVASRFEPQHVVRFSNQASWTKVQRGVRRGNWSGGWFWCRWPEMF